MMALNTKAFGNVPAVCFPERGIRRLDTLSGCLASEALIKARRDKRPLTAMTDWSHVVYFLSRPGILPALPPQSRKFVSPVKNCFISNGSLYRPLTSDLLLLPRCSVPAAPHTSQSTVVEEHFLLGLWVIWLQPGTGRQLRELDPLLSFGFVCLFVFSC